MSCHRLHDFILAGVSYINSVIVLNKREGISGDTHNITV